MVILRKLSAHRWAEGAGASMAKHAITGRWDLCFIDSIDAMLHRFLPSR
jgi:hypothetical protein